MKKKVLALLLMVAVLSPALAFAGSSTDAALGLGAFAVFNQILSGTGIFGGLYGAPAPAVAAPVVVAPPPAVYYAPPQAYYAPPPPVFVAPPPPVYYAPRRAYYAPHRPVIERGWCPAGHGYHGRC